MSEDLAAYRHAAARVARPLRVAGLALTILALVLAMWPGLSKAVPLAIAALALLHLLAAISVRLRRPKPQMPAPDWLTPRS